MLWEAARGETPKCYTDMKALQNNGDQRKLLSFQPIRTDASFAVYWTTVVDNPFCWQNPRFMVCPCSDEEILRRLVEGRMKGQPVGAQANKKRGEEDRNVSPNLHPLYGMKTPSYEPICWERREKW